MAPRIDPALPLVWRSPTDLQLGAAEALVVIPNPGEVETGLLTALRHGASVQTLLTIGSALGGTPDGVRRFLAMLEPAFTAETSTCGSGRPSAGDRMPLVAVDATDPFARHLASALEALGHAVVVTDDESAEQATLAVLASTWAVPPAGHLPWLRRDVPHLAVVFDDTGVRVGPLVEPGDGPCLRCIDLARRDVDPAWPAIAAQLARRPAATYTLRAALDAAALAAAVVDDRIVHGVTRLAAASVTLGRAGAPPRSQRHESHPECGCRAPGGTAMAPVRLDDRRPTATRSASVGAAPA
jgi:hypothetical protein